MLMCVRLIVLGLILITAESVYSLDNLDFDSSNKEEDQDVISVNKPDILTHAEITEKIGYVMKVISEARALMDILKNQFAPIMTKQDPSNMLPYPSITTKEPDSESIEYQPEDSETNELSPDYGSLTEKPLATTTMQQASQENYADSMTKLDPGYLLPHTRTTSDTESIDYSSEDSELNALLPNHDALARQPLSTTSAHSSSQDYHDEELLPNLKSKNTENNMARINVQKTSDPQKRFTSRVRRLQSILDQGKAYLEKLILEKELKEQEDSLQTDSQIDNSMPSSENNLNRRNIAQKKKELDMTIRRLSNLYNTLP